MAPKIGQKKKMWSDDVKARVVQEARRLRPKFPAYSDLKLIRVAQNVLPLDLRREIGTIATPQYEWFREGLAAEVTQEVTQEVTFEVTPDEVVTGGQEVVEVVEYRGDPSVPPGFHAILNDLVRVLEEQHETHKQMIREITNELRLTQAKLTDQTARLDRLLRFGMQFRVIPIDANVPIPAAEYQPPRPIYDPAPRGHTNGHIEGNTEGNITRTRRPRVIVLSLESGHQKNGIRHHVGERFSKLEFWEHPPVSKISVLNPFDYIICTKKTPLDFVAEAKKIFGPTKVRAFPGDAHKIGEAMLSLPDITEA